MEEYLANVGFIKLLFKEFEGKEIVFIEHSDYFPPNNELFEPKNKIHFTKCRVVILDPREQCCSTMLAHFLVDFVKKQSLEHQILTVLQHPSPCSSEMGEILMTNGSFIENKDLIFAKISKWFNFLNKEP